MKNIKTMKQQKGAALAIGMVLLLIITVIGVNSMKSALLQDRMATGLKNREIADAAAMSLLVEAERWLFDYYQHSNGVDLGIGSNYMVDPRSDEAYSFKTNRDLSGGWSDLIDINAQFGGKLADEPRFMIEPQNDASSSGNSGSGTAYTNTDAEDDDGAAGGAGGGGPNDGANASSKLRLYRIVSKATDTTGHLFTAFESVISVKAN